MSPREPKQKTLQRMTGDQGEAIVADFLAQRGFEILDRNWSCREGELDVVARQGSLLAFVEVKSVSTGFLDTALLSVTPAKQRKVARAAEAWLEAHEISVDGIRFDVAAIDFLHMPPRIEYVPDAFTPEWAF